MSETDLAIDLRRVAKTYRGRVYALRGIDMRVRRGEVFGLLGPNGAGKSTLVKIIMTVIRPTHAEGSVLGSPVGHKPTLARVGYLPENHRFPRYLTGRQTLDFFAALSKVPRRARKQNADRLLDVVGMTAWAKKRIGTYSKGMMQRIGLAQAMMNDPDLILLDEPTDGVDPVGRREIRDVLLNLKSAGKTVFINSHLLSELEMICDRVGILVAGQVATQGTLDELALSKQWYEVEVAQNGSSPTESIRAALNGAVTWTEPAPQTAPATVIDHGALSNGTWIELEGAKLRIGTTDALQVQPVLDALRRANLPLRRVQPIRPSLEELFMAALAQNQSGTAAGARI
jgi:ABC-2 type transport system ATP-binding protein